MSEFKGTQGKWRIFYCNRDDSYDVENDEQVFICTTMNSLHEQKYNALLISKAPEMLEMLNNILKERKEVGNHVPFQEIEQLIKEATEL